MAAILQPKHDLSPQDTSFTVTNITEAFSLNCNANNDLLTADTLGTLIKELIAKGVINGTVA
jgi:hypothetical protein